MEETRVLPTEPAKAARESVAAAAEILAAGGAVALPTETVYGLAADAFNADAVAAVFEIKGRPRFDPLIVHVGSRRIMGGVAEASETVFALADTFWPGPLTFVLPKAPAVPDIVTAGLDTVAVRMSAHPVMKMVLHALDRPLAAPSANRFGGVSPTSASAVVAELGGKIPLVLDGGACSWGIESTIVRVDESGPRPRIEVLRPGPVTVEDLRKFGKVTVADPTVRPGAAASAPGQLASHYAPATPLRLVDDPASFSPEPGKRYALLSYRGSPKDGFLDLAPFEQVAVLSPGSGKLAEAAVRLFFSLRQLDALGVDEIVAEPVPARGLGLAIMDRLRRASA